MITAILDRPVSSHCPQRRAGCRDPLHPAAAARVCDDGPNRREEVLNLADLVARAISTSYPAIRARRHQLTVRVPQRFVWLEEDPARLEQALIRLLTSAARSAEPGGTLQLTLTHEHHEAVLRVGADSPGRATEFTLRLPTLQKSSDPSRE